MLQRILDGLTGALMAASFSGNNSSASPLEDSLAVPPEHRRGLVRSHPAGARRMMRGQATRQAIVEAARRLFSERGYFATKVDDIAALARVAPATVYAVSGPHHSSGSHLRSRALDRTRA